MNEEALKYSFKLFKADGYNGTIEDYKTLIKENEEALGYSHKLFSNDGYNGSIEDFSILVGVGNQQGPVKETAIVGSENQAVNGDSVSDPGLLELKKYDDATRLTNEDIISINSEIENIDFTPITKTEYSPVGYIGGNYSYQVTEQPYEEYLKAAENQLNKNITNGEKPSRKQIEQRALDLIKEEKKFNILKEKNKKYLSELPEEERIKIGQEKAGKFIKQTYEIEKDFEAINLAAEKYNNGANIKNIESFSKALNDPNYKIDISFALENNEPIVTLNDGRQAPKALLDSYQEAVNKHNEHFRFMKKSIDDYVAKIEEQSNLASDVDFLKRNYDKLEKLGAIAELSIAEVGGGVYGALLDLSEIRAAAPIAKGQKKALNEVRKEAQRAIREDYAYSVDFENAFDNLENFGEWSTEALAGQTGTLLALSTGQVAGLTGIGLSSYGRTISDIEILDEERKSETSNLEKRLTALGYASFEVALGSIPTIKILNSTAKNLAGNEARSFYKGVGDYMKKNWKGIPDPFVTEFVSEGGTQFFQNGIDVIRGEKDLQNIWEGVPEASVTGGMFGATLGSVPLLKGAGLAALSDYNKYNEFRENSLTIATLNKEIATLDKRTTEYKNKVKLINDLTSTNSEILNTIENNISNNLSPEGFKLYQEATAQQEQIRAEAEAVQKRKDLTPSAKEKILSTLKNNFDVLQSQRDLFKKDFKNIFNIETKAVQKKYTELAEQALAGENITDSNKIKKKAQELYGIDKIKDRNQKAINAIKTLRKGGIINNYYYENSNTRLLEIYKENLNQQVEKGIKSKTAANKEYLEVKKNIIDGVVNGLNMPVIQNGKIKSYDIYVSQENALKNGKTETPIHELGHSIFIESLGTNPEAYSDLASEILNYLKRTNESAFNRIIVKTTGQGADEVLTNFLEEVSSGRLDLEAKNNKSFTASIGLKLRNIFYKTTKKEDIFTFSGISDINTFLTTLGKKLKEGTLSVEDVKTIQAEGIANTKLKNLKESKPKIFKSSQADIQEQLKALEDQLMDNSIDYDTYERKIVALEKQLEEAEKKEIEEKAKPKPKKQKESDVSLKDASAKSKKILDDIGNDPKGFNKNNPKIYEVLEGIIKSKSMTFRTASGNVVNLTNLPGFEMENMVAETISYMVPMINKFDPKKNDSLYGYLNSQLANKMRQALKSGKVTEERFTDDVTEVKGLAEEEVTVTKAEKPKYTKIMDADVFDTDVINAISDKMVSTVRVLKNKLNAAIGKNQNTTPLIKEILQDISTQADIDIKKAMGGKEDGKLRKFLLKNKQAIIENSTTTFLMGKDQGDKVLGGLPIAIQKQVDGKFLSYPDWIGKKIDRETTAARGATAGNQIVRRVPASKISDADYLSFFLEPTGNPIRGRKEALAKELAGEIGLELFVEAAEAGSGEIFDAFQKNQELLGDVLRDNYEAEIIKQVERGTIKFSTSITNKQLFELFNALNQRNKTNRTNAVIKFFEDNKELDEKELRFKIVNPLLEVYDKIDKIVIKGKARDKGLAFESVFKTQFAKAAGKIKGLNNSTISIGEDKLDITFSYNRQRYGLELKFDSSARISGFTVSKLGNLIEGKSPSLSIKSQKNKILDFVTNKKDIQNYINKALELGAKIIDGDLYINEDLYARFSDENDLKPLFTKANESLKIKMPWSFIADIYNDKSSNVKMNYIHFLDIGTFYLGDNPINVQGLPEFATYTKKKNGELAEDLGIVSTGRLISIKSESLGLRKISLKFKNQIADIAFKEKLAEKSTFNISAGETGVIKFFEKADPLLSSNYNSNAAFLENLAERLNPSLEQKGISIWDFDDTLATTKSNVLYTLSDGTKGKMNAEEFAKQGDDLLEQGAEFDFSEFSKVMNGAKGPMFDKAIARNKKFGNDNVYILTARPANSATAIHEFLKGLGLDIKLENIIGLGNSTAQAKADWINSKVAEGYNDFYFADDAYKNVKAVQDILDIADVKSKVQQAYIKFSQAADPKMLNKEFNLMLERKKGLKAGAKISRARAEQLGKNKGRYRYFLPPNAEDFNGLLYNFLGKGDIGDKDFQFFKEYLIDPFNIAENAISSFRQRLAENLRILKKELGNIDKDISKETIKKIEAIGFTPDQAVRVFIWNRKGEDIPELKADEKAKILGIVRRDPKLMAYARELMKITDQFGGYPPPSDTWFAGNSKSDMYKFANENVRKKYLENWQANADAIFNSDNMNKLQALYGKDFVINLKQILGRMKSGSNRPIGMNDAGSKMLDYINGSVGVIMFLNVRSAVLQTISSVNFLNWHDNNLFAAGKTLANPKNFAKSFIEIMNSDFLKQRRSGLEINVNEAEIATAAEQSKNKAKALFNSIIKAGYKPTQFADSFAIAIGGTPFLINRTKTYEKQGLSAAEAKEKAFADFREIAEENQQSSRTDKTSNIQASNLGRVVFAFNNTPFQYTRIMKKAVLDIANRRGDLKTNISKILYYGAIQNIIFYTLQQAIMASLFGVGDDEDEVKKQSEKIERLGNSMLDSILRGSGLPGAVISTAKNVIIEYMAQEEKGSFRADHGKTLIQALNFSPPIGSKASKIYTGIKGAKYEETTMDMLKNKSKIVSAVTNFPVDRLVTKTDNLIVATTEPIETWKRAALFLGWDQWSLGVYDDLKEVKGGEKPKANRSEIMKEVWRKRKEEDKKERDSIRGLRKKMSAEDLLKSLVKEKTKK